MIRSWGLVTSTATAMPWFGDVTTAAVGLPGSNGLIPVTVGSTTRYRVGDRIVLDPEQTNQDTLLVIGIASSTVLNCMSEGNCPTHTHANGAIIQLSIAAMDIIFDNVGAGEIVLGTDNTVTTGPTGGSAFKVLQPVTSPAQPNTFRLAGSIGGANTCRTSDGWMIGSSTVLVSAVVL
jgi:hypothetical protein